MRDNRFKGLATYRSGLIWMLCCLYLIFSVGIVKASHFCMGREASVSYFTSEVEKCPCSLFANEKDNCCKDEHSLLKLEDSQKNLSSFVLTIPAFVCLGDVFSGESVFRAPGTAQARSLGAPDQQLPPKLLFQLHCSYVFYDDSSLV